MIDKKQLVRKLKEAITSLEEMQKLLAEPASDSEILQFVVGLQKQLILLANLDGLLIKYRGTEDRERARMKGRKGGRPRVGDHVVHKILSLRRQGKSYTQISKEVGRTRGSVEGICRRYRVSRKGCDKRRLDSLRKL